MAGRLVAPSFWDRSEAMPRRRIAACCAAVAVIVACVAVVGLARGEVLDETSLVINQPSGNDYVLRRQAMHREEQADAAARRASLATEQASSVEALEEQAAAKISRETTASNAALKRYADMVSFPTPAPERLPQPAVAEHVSVRPAAAEPAKRVAPVKPAVAEPASVRQADPATVKKDAPVERGADTSQQLSAWKEPRAETGSGGLQGLIGSALGEMARIAAKLRGASAGGGSDGGSAVDAGRERNSLRGIVEGTELKLEGLQERVFEKESGAAAPARSVEGFSAPRPHAARRARLSEADEYKLQARKRLVQGATNGAAGGETALDAAISEHEELPAHEASTTPDVDPRREFSRPRLDEARYDRGGGGGRAGTAAAVAGGGRSVARQQTQGAGAEAGKMDVPSDSSMERKLKAWEAARSHGSGARSASSPQALAARREESVPQPAPRWVRAAASRVLSVCDQVNAAHAGDAAGAEVACHQVPGCAFDFGRQACAV